ncbi:hypothetical protein [Streptomyces olindensis]|uniref:hypothetical protein n=1 Tax=Streptomyces olindensis TaxID=358823 RepID=UPI00364C2D5B
MVTTTSAGVQPRAGRLGVGLRYWRHNGELGPPLLDGLTAANPEVHFNAPAG